MYKIINKETGKDGTQVQFPVEAVKEYFGNDARTNVRFLLMVHGRPYQVQLTHHGNNTHRIVMPFLAGVARPAVLRFKRLSAFVFQVAVFDEHDAHFARTRRNGTVSRIGANPYRIV